MNEADWLSCQDPAAMLRWLEGNGMATDRRLRLFACACCRRIWHLLLDARSRKAVEVAERYADGDADSDKLRKAAQEAENGAWDEERRYVNGDRESSARALAEEAAGISVESAVVAVCLLDADQAASAAALAAYRAWTEQGPAYATLLRCIFGNPFRPVSFNPVWQTPDVITLAGRIYHDRAFGRIRELAAALEDAGCTDPDVLRHCRWEEGHVRGCWLIDLLLPKG